MGCDGNAVVDVGKFSWVLDVGGGVLFELGVAKNEV